jgi:hypothetical protein
MPIKPGSPEWIAKVARMVAAERLQPVGWFFLSFAGDVGFRGGVYIQAQGPTLAHSRSHQLGLNPGGSVEITQVPDESLLPAPEYRHRLLSRAELEALDV